MCWIGLFYFLGHGLIISIDGLVDENQKAEYAIVLGSKVHEDGTLSERLKSRVHKGFELIESGHCNNIIVSGGLGKEGYYEGSKMADYLLKLGVDSNKIIIDNLGNTTHLTAVNAKKIIDLNTSIIVVSQYFHVSRCKLALRQEGFTEVTGAHSHHFEWRDAMGIFREFFAYYKYLFAY